MHLHRLYFNLTLVAVTLCVYLSVGYSQEVIVENNVTMKTRDSVILRADVYRPSPTAGSLSFSSGPRMTNGVKSPLE